MFMTANYRDQGSVYPLFVHPVPLSLLFLSLKHNLLLLAPFEKQGTRRLGTRSRRERQVRSEETHKATSPLALHYES